MPAAARSASSCTRRIASPARGIDGVARVIGIPSSRSVSGRIRSACAARRCTISTDEPIWIVSPMVMAHPLARFDDAVLDARSVHAADVFEVHRLADVQAGVRARRQRIVDADGVALAAPDGERARRRQIVGRVGVAPDDQQEGAGGVGAPRRVAALAVCLTPAEYADGRPVAARRLHNLCKTAQLAHKSSR